MSIKIKIGDLSYRNHLSHKEIIVLENRNQEKKDCYHYVISKPQGLWYGFKDSWLNWQSSDEEYAEIREKDYLYIINIDEQNFVDIQSATKDTSKILRLNNKEDYKIFYERYKIKINS